MGLVVLVAAEAGYFDVRVLQMKRDEFLGVRLVFFGQRSRAQKEKVQALRHEVKGIFQADGCVKS